MQGGSIHLGTCIHIQSDAVDLEAYIYVVVQCQNIPKIIHVLSINTTINEITSSGCFNPSVSVICCRMSSCFIAIGTRRPS